MSVERKIIISLAFVRSVNGTRPFEWAERSEMKGFHFGFRADTMPTFRCVRAVSVFVSLLYVFCMCVSDSVCVNLGA